MRESPIQITLTIHLVLSIDPAEQYPLAAVAEFLTEQSIESTLLESLIERLNEVLVEAYCGEKHAPGNGTKRFQRSATSTRSAVTTAGEHEFTLDYVEDTDEATIFGPSKTSSTSMGKTLSAGHLRPSR